MSSFDSQITVIDFDHNVLYDTLVKPRNPVIDYVTQVGSRPSPDPTHSLTHSLTHKNKLLTRSLAATSLCPLPIPLTLILTQTLTRTPPSCPRLLLIQFSGITEKLLRPCVTRLEDVQRHVTSMLPVETVCGAMVCCGSWCQCWCAYQCRCRCWCG